MTIQSFAFNALVDVGDNLELVVSRLDGDDRVAISAGIFGLNFPVDDAHLVIGAIARVLDEDRQKRGEIAVVDLDADQVPVGFSLSNDGHHLWINCAPFHLRLPVFAAKYLIGTLSEARRQHRGEKAVLDAAVAS